MKFETKNPQEVQSLAPVQNAALLSAVLLAVTAFENDKQTVLGKHTTALDADFVLETYVYSDWAGLMDNFFDIHKYDEKTKAPIALLDAVSLKNNEFKAAGITQVRLWRVMLGKTQVLGNIALSYLQNSGYAEKTVKFTAQKLAALSVTVLRQKLFEVKNGDGTAIDYVDNNYKAKQPVFDWASMLELKPELAVLTGLNITCTKTRVHISIDTLDDWHKFNTFALSLPLGHTISVQNIVKFYTREGDTYSTEGVITTLDIVRMLVWEQIGKYKLEFTLNVVHVTTV
jgi:hypothetical protein